MDNEPLRECQECGLNANNEFDLDLFVKKSDAKYGRRNLCKSCRNSLHRNDGKKWTQNQVDKVKEWHDKHPERVKEIKKRSHEKRISFKGKRITLDAPPRTGKCNQCGFEGQTVIHHEKYDPSDPMAHTVEMCISCHSKIHRRRKKNE